MATRAEVLNAYASNPGATQNPDESAIQYWMNTGVGNFDKIVDQYNAENPDSPTAQAARAKANSSPLTLADLPANAGINEDKSQTVVQQPVTLADLPAGSGLGADTSQTVELPAGGLPSTAAEVAGALPAGPKYTLSPEQQALADKAAAGGYKTNSIAGANSADILQSMANQYAANRPNYTLNEDNNPSPLAAMTSEQALAALTDPNRYGDASSQNAPLEQYDYNGQKLTFNPNGGGVQTAEDTGITDGGTNKLIVSYYPDANGVMTPSYEWQDVRGSGGWLSRNFEGIVKSAISSIATAGMTPGLTDVFGTTALGKAATQAIVNGVSSAIQGQDVLKGMVTGALGSAGSTLVGNQIGKIVENVTADVAKEMPGVFLNKATTDAIGSAITGAAKAAITGQDIVQGALTGGASSYLNSTLSSQLKEMFPDNPNLDKAAAKFISAGLINPSSVTNPASLIKAMTSAWSAISADDKAAAGLTKDDEQAVKDVATSVDDTKSGLSTLDNPNAVTVVGDSLGTGDYTPTSLDSSLIQDAVTTLPATANDTVTGGLPTSLGDLPAGTGQSADTSQTVSPEQSLTVSGDTGGEGSDEYTSPLDTLTPTNTGETKTDTKNDVVTVTGSTGTDDYTSPLDTVDDKTGLPVDTKTGLPTVTVIDKKTDVPEYDPITITGDLPVDDIVDDKKDTVVGGGGNDVITKDLDVIKTEPATGLPTITVTDTKPVEPDYVPPDVVVPPFVPTVAPTAPPTQPPTVAPTVAPTSAPKTQPVASAGQSGCSKIPWLDSTESMLKNTIANKKMALAQQSLKNIYDKGEDGVPEINLDPYGAKQGGLIHGYATGDSVKCLNQDPAYMPKFLDTASEVLQSSPSTKRSALGLKPLTHIHQSISSQGNMGGLAQGGLPKKYHDAMPDGHKPEFVTGLTGYYACGGGTGQSDDIPAMLHDGDYVMDADVVASLGDGSSKAGREILDGFRTKVPHQDKAEGHPVPAKIADGEYVFPAGFVTALGGGDNKAGAKILNGLREKLREHKRSAPTSKIPPKAKSPLDYIKQAKG